jgi:hypothetical protein
MKLICVDYPFGESSRRYYPTLTEAKKDALDRYLVQEEIEDEEGATEASISYSRAKANVYEVEIPLRKSVLSSLFNNEPYSLYNEQTLIHQFRYRRGKIVVSNKVSMETPE